MIVYYGYGLAAGGRPRGGYAMSNHSLYEYFACIPDPRRPAGTRYPLASMLSLMLAAMLGGRTSLRSIARWGKTLSLEQLLALGIERGRAPGQTAMHDLLCLLPAGAVEEALSAWASELGQECPKRQIILDGKTLKGSAGGDYPALHLLSAYCPQMSLVLSERAVPAKENEITAGKAMLATLPVKGAVVTGDAMFCQRDFCELIKNGGGDFLFTVKNNQPGLRDDIKEAFAPSFSPGGGAKKGKVHPPLPNGREKP
jgi:hypothetical protein